MEQLKNKCKILQTTYDVTVLDKINDKSIIDIFRNIVKEAFQNPELGGDRYLIHILYKYFYKNTYSSPIVDQERNEINSLPTIDYQDMDDEHLSELTLDLFEDEYTPITQIEYKDTLNNDISNSIVNLDSLIKDILDDEDVLDETQNLSDEDVLDETQNLSDEEVLDETQNPSYEEVLDETQNPSDEDVLDDLYKPNYLLTTPYSLSYDSYLLQDNI